jgi:hypothetical protein
VQRRSSAVAHDGQLALHDGEARTQRRVQVLAEDARTWERRQFGDRAV